MSTTELINKLRESMDSEYIQTHDEEVIELLGEAAECLGALLSAAKALSRDLTDKLRDICRITAERDEAVKDIENVLIEVERIRLKSVLDADTDDALADLCGTVCGECGEGCFLEGEREYGCANFNWKGAKK